MKWVYGYAYDAMNSVRFAFHEWGKAIDRAMDVWGTDD